MTPAEMVPLVGLGAILGLDVVSLPQAMISRPIVAATLGGALIGDAEKGLLLGAVLEMIALGTLPFGAARYPEWGSASVVGGGLFAHATSPNHAGQLALVVLATLASAWLSGESMVWLRKVNARVERRLRPRLVEGDYTAIRALHLRGLAGDLTRGAAVTAISLGVLAPAYRRALPMWNGSETTEAVAMAGITAALGGATIWMLVRGARGARRLLAIGIATAVVAILVL